MTAPAEHLPLAAEFEPSTRPAWRELVSAVLTKSGAASPAADPELMLATATYDGFDLAPLYTADDLPDGLQTGLPGHAPFVRGRKIDGSAAIGWDVRQRHNDPDPIRLNKALLTDLENGCTSVWLVLGSSGLAVGDLEAALKDVYLDLAPIALDAGSRTAEAAQAFLDVIRDRAIDPGQVCGTLGADPLGWYARTGAEPDLAGLVELFDRTRECSNLNVATVDASIYHDAGGSDSDEIAVATAVAVAYLRSWTDGGVELDQALDRIEFRFAVTADQFSSIAKLRAARQVWDRVAELSGAVAHQRGQRQHAVTSAAMLTKRDPWVNMLRTTIACFAAAVGGAEAITVLPFDSAIGVSDDFARRIARNTQAVLHDESSLARVIDPAGGSFYVERLTQQLADAAWEKFTAIEREGGALAALRSGHIPDLLARTAAVRREAIAHRRDAITGVSEFAFVAEPQVVRPPAPPGPDAGLLPVLRYAQDFELLRDRSDAHLESTGSRPKILLAGLGPVAAHSARMAFASNLFQAGGILPVEASGDIGQLLAQLADLAKLGPAVVCLCSSDKVYAELATVAARAFTEAGARAVYLAGKPGDRSASDKDAGISKYAFAGCDAIEVLDATLSELEVA
jgi:methylmalonyl-CoA mutase